MNGKESGGLLEAGEASRSSRVDVKNQWGQREEWSSGVRMWRAEERVA